MKLLITGMKQHGKDTVCELLASISGGRLAYISSSLALIDEGIFDDDIKAFYPEAVLAHGIEDVRSIFYVERDMHRKLMFNRINEYCVKGTETAELIFNTYKCDIYNGMRNNREFYACKNAGLFDLTIWVDGSERKPAESKDSMKLTKYDCDIILDNNGTLSQLQDRCERLVALILGWENKHKDDLK